MLVAPALLLTDPVPDIIPVNAWSAEELEYIREPLFVMSPV